MAAAVVALLKAQQIMKRWRERIRIFEINQTCGHCHSPLAGSAGGAATVFGSAGGLAAAAGVGAAAAGVAADLATWLAAEGEPTAGAATG